MASKGKILFIGIAESIHTARWIQQIKNSGYDLYLFPSFDNGIVHPGLSHLKVCIPFFFLQKVAKNLGLESLYRVTYKLAKLVLMRIDKQYYTKRLRRCIKHIQPHVIHTLETQGAGYLAYEVKEKYYSGVAFPKWWHTNWGSDIFLFGRLAAHKHRIRNVLESANYYSSECHRDVDLALEFGFKGHVMPVYPNTGGFNLKVIDALRANTVPTSQRKVIMLKGYQGWAGRCLVGLRALTLVKDLLAGYRVVIFSNASGDDVSIAAELFSGETLVPVEIVPLKTDHLEILKMHSKARISIGLSISDAISTSVLEAMSVGSFPIQSNTSSAGEWFYDGSTGYLVPPEDPNIIADYIRSALLDDVLVDRANEANWEVIAHRLDENVINQATHNSYLEIFKTLN